MYFPPQVSHLCTQRRSTARRASAERRDCFGGVRVAHEFSVVAPRLSGLFVSLQPRPSPSCARGPWIEAPEEQGMPPQSAMPSVETRCSASRAIGQRETAPVVSSEALRVHAASLAEQHAAVLQTEGKAACRHRWLAGKQLANDRHIPDLRTSQSRTAPMAAGGFGVICGGTSSTGLRRCGAFSTQVSHKFPAEAHMTAQVCRHDCASGRRECCDRRLCCTPLLTGVPRRRELRPRQCAL